MGLAARYLSKFLSALCAAKTHSVFRELRRPFVCVDCLPHLLHAALRTPPPLMTVPDTDSGEDLVSASDLCQPYSLLALNATAGIAGFILR